MKLTVVLAALIGILVLACSSAAPAPVEPTPNIDATVEARLAQERAVDATVEARAKELVAEQPTATPYPTYTPVPTATPPPKPTDTPVPQPTNTPTVVPTATSVPTPTPRPIPTPTPAPTPTPVSYFCDGKTIRFKIGSVWANETLIFNGAEHSMLTITASTASLSSNNIISWPISYLTRPYHHKFFAYPTWHAITGSVNAPDYTNISAWINGVQVKNTMAIEGEFSLLIERNDCLISRGIATPTPIPTPTPTPTPTPITKFFKECSFGQYGANHEFVGEASRSNDGPVNGAYVSAWIGNIEMVRTKSGTWGYLLLIPSCTDAREFNSEGAIIKFSIGGFWAEQTSILEGGSADILNLHQTNDPVVIN